MGDSAGSSNFVSETFEQSLIAHGGLGKEFESDRLPQSQVIGPVDFSHAALAQKCDDTVAACDEVSGQEAAFAESSRRTGRPKPRSGNLYSWGCRSKIKRSQIAAVRNGFAARRAKSSGRREVRTAGYAGRHEISRYSLPRNSIRLSPQRTKPRLSKTSSV